MPLELIRTLPIISTSASALFLTLQGATNERFDSVYLAWFALHGVGIVLRCNQCWLSANGGILRFRRYLAWFRLGIAGKRSIINQGAINED